MTGEEWSFGMEIDRYRITKVFIDPLIDTISAQVVKLHLEARQLRPYDQNSTILAA